MTPIERKPAIGRRHPADNLPDKPAPDPAPAPPPPTRETLEPAAPLPPQVPLDERLIEQHNVRIRPSTKARLKRAVDRMRYETGDRSISEASLTDRSIREFLDRNGG
ncbi:hypothetical protein A5780_26460 [Nocardia sp. 852002-20019_SCH5090214]|nr:hypothetical protein A5780_26460 [Nocardia sp. 852002-20019_SCH5090214]